MKQLLVKSTRLWVAGAVAVTGIVVGQKQPSTIISSARPLNIAADRLQSVFGAAISYEDPVWSWRAELHTLGKDAIGKWLFPIPQNLEMPAVSRSNNLGAVLGEIVKSYDANTSGPRFGVVQTKVGWDIIPTEEHSQDGRLSRSERPMDVPIRVFETPRTASAHLDAICEALTQRRRMKVTCDYSGVRPWFDGLFASPEPTFTWGANDVPARDALVDLLSRSATTFCWRFLCQGVSNPQDQFCVLNLRPVLVETKDENGSVVKRPLNFDRCPSCRGVTPNSAGQHNSQ